MNSASRVLSIYDSLLQLNSNQDRTMVLMWAEVFSVDQKLPHWEDEVSLRLHALRDEIDFTAVALRAHGVPEELFQDGFNRFRKVGAATLLQGGWHGYRASVMTGDVRQPLLWAAWVLRDEDEEGISPEVLAELQSDLDALEDHLQSVNLSAYLRGFVQRQIDAIRGALKIYRIRGALPLKQALQTVAGAVHTESATLQEEVDASSTEAKTFLSRFSGTFNKAAEVFDGVSKISAGSKLVWKGGAVVVQFLKDQMMNGAG